MQITLNVGGVRYTTTKHTLLRESSTYFSGLLSGHFDHDDEERVPGSPAVERVLSLDDDEAQVQWMERQKRARESRSPVREYFIDRCGMRFQHILNYLRSGRIHTSHDRVELEALLEEATFYQISSLVQLLERRIQDAVFVEQDKAVYRDEILSSLKSINDHLRTGVALKQHPLNNDVLSKLLSMKAEDPGNAEGLVVSPTRHRRPSVVLEGEFELDADF